MNQDNFFGYLVDKIPLVTPSRVLTWPGTPDTHTPSQVLTWPGTSDTLGRMVCAPETGDQPKDTS